MKNNVKQTGKQLVALFLLCLLLSALCACGAKAVPVPKAEFSSGMLEEHTFSHFSLSYPSSWNVVIDADEDKAEYGDVFFEVASPMDGNNENSRVQLLKASHSNKRKITRVISLNDINTVVSEFQKTYGVSITLEESAIYDYEQGKGVYLKVSFNKNEVSYVLCQTYFLLDGDVYIISAIIANGNDAENAFAVTHSLKFIEK